VETPGGSAGAGQPFRATLAFEPATGLYRVRADLRDADLAALAGLPSALLGQLGVQLPPETRGRLTGQVNLAGRRGDPTALRGQVNLRAEGLGVQGETPTGRLEARLTATASRVDVETFSLRLPGGDITGRGGVTVATGRLDLPIRADLRDAAAFARGFGLRGLGGRAMLHGRVRGTREAPRLQGRLTWRDARIAGQLLDHIEGEVEVARRTLWTPRLTVRSGQTIAVLQGSVEASGTTPLRQLNPMRDLVLDVLMRVNPGRTADLVGLLPDDVEVRGAFRAGGRLRGTLQALTGEVAVGLENFQTWEEAWQQGEARFRLRPGEVEISQISLRRGAEQVTGEIGIGAGGTLRGRLTSTVMDVAKIGSLSGSQVGGRAAFRLDLQGTLRDTVTRGQATASALLYRDIPAGPGTATFKIERKAVDVDVTFRDGTHRLRVSVGPPSDRSVKGELILSDADLDLVARAAGSEMLHAAQPWGSGRILFGGPAHAPVFARGEADFASLRLRLEGETWENRGPVRASWSGPVMTVQQLRLQAGLREFEVRGTLGEGAQTDLTVTGQVPLVLLADYLPVVRPTEGLANLNVRLRGDARGRAAQGKLEVQQGRLRLSGIPAEFRNVRATLDLRRSRAQIRNWQAQLAEGSFRGTGEIGWAGEHWDLRLTFQEDDGRVEQLAAGLTPGNGETTGAVSLGGILTSRGVTAADFWRNLDGDLKLVMRNGRLGRYGLAAKILALVNVAQLLQFKDPELDAEGMPYDRMTAEIKIAHGVARTENLVLDSRAMKMNAVGTLDLADETVDLTVAVKPLQNIDSILTNIPIAGWLLGGKEKSILVAYYRVTGSLRDPRVTAVPAQSIGRNVFGIIRNLLEIPEALTGPYEDLPPQPIKPEEGPRR
jgi:autotransporter translocation and assembly factor TamB